MEKGKVKFFDNEKGFGFIERKKRKDVHIGFDSFKGFIPKEGDIVKFKLIKEPKGLHAKDMQLIKKGDKTKSKKLKPKKRSQKQIKDYQLPKDTREILNKNFTDFDNYNLMYQKYIKIGPKNKFDLPDIKKDFRFKYLKNYNEKFSHNLRQTRKNINFIGFKAKTASRLLVGFGNPSVFETSLKLDHIYGFPYIPGSAIKGVLRNYLINKYFKNSDGNADEEIALKDKGFCDIFGCPKKKSYYEKERQGKIFFMDSIPKEYPKIEEDIMTPHFGEYYNSQGKEPPADYYSPTIIPFLSVAKDIEFNFFIGIKKQDIEYSIENSSKLVEDDTNLLEFIKKKMIEALEFQG
ncbi:MAG: type III-B CRISPR module RAMP protein Cmr6, partial [Candidatus Lokiarchaeota archaeon]|nr:type III-B CRISPR module RAMP protein Cmr6 [Candidatus Lokiarchaeota archaeon]